MNQNKKSERGVTAIELLIVVALIGIVSALAGPNLSEMVARGRMKEGVRALQSNVTVCRNQAISSGMFCRFSVVNVDDNPAGPAGSWMGSVRWDLCQLDSTPGGPCNPPPSGPLTPNTFEQLDFFNGIAGEGIPNVSIAGPMPSWAYLEFDVDGVLTNPASDFTNGVVTLEVVSKKSSFDTSIYVNIDRGGNVKTTNPLNSVPAN